MFSIPVGGANTASTNILAGLEEPLRGGKKRGKRDYMGRKGRKCMERIRENLPEINMCLRPCANKNYKNRN